MSIKYVAADVHAATTSFCVREADGRVTTEAVVETQGAALIAFVQGLPGTIHLTFEEGTHAAWLARLLRPQVAKLIVCNPAHNRLVSTGAKSDRIDSRALSHLLRLEALQAVYHGAQGLDALKELVHAHRELVIDSTRVKNRLRACFRSRGIAVPGGRLYRPATRDTWVTQLTDPAARARVTWLGRQLDQVEALRRECRLAVVRESRHHPACRWLRTVPGIGTIRAAEIVSVVESPYRFRTKRQFWSYAGLGIVTRSSGDYRPTPTGITRRPRLQVRGLNRNFNRTLKTVFKGAAVTARQGAFKDAYATRVAAGMRPELARVTLARRLAAICLTLWKRGEVYDVTKAFPPTA